MNEFGQPIIEATGGIYIGRNFFRSFQATRPFGKIELYQGVVILKVQFIPRFILRLFQWAGKIPFMIGIYKNFPEKIILPYSDIVSYTQTNSSTIMGCGIRL